MYPVNDANERSQVEMVFGLTGGELEDAPLRYLERDRWDSDGSYRDSHTRRWARYWYPGIPDYAGELKRLQYDCITVVWNRLYSGFAPQRIRAHGKTWRKVADFADSGETECINVWDPQDGTCPLCESDHSGPSYVYIGDGWYETVYYSRS